MIQLIFINFILIITISKNIQKNFITLFLNLNYLNLKFKNIN